MAGSARAGVELSPIRQAVLLVGGLGTRLRPLTDRLPKALMPLANLPLIAYEIIPFVRAGITRIVLAMGYKADLLKAQLGDGRVYGAELIYVEEPEPMGTAGALLNAARHLDGTFFACNGDMIYDVDLAALARDHLQREALVTFCLRQTPDVEHFGLVQWTDDGRVARFHEKVPFDETGRNTVNSGFYVMSREVLSYIPEGQAYSSERQLFPDLLARGSPLYAHLPSGQGYWADVGRIETYLQASGDVLEGVLPWFRPSRGRGRTDGAQVALSVDVGAGAVVMPRTSIGEIVAIGANCVVEDGAVVSDSVLWPGSMIGAGAHVERSVVAGATVGPGSEVFGEVIVG